MGFEEAHEAIESAYGNGQDGQKTTPEVTAPPVPEQVQLTELDKLERFKFEGKEMTLDELRKSIMLDKDYRKKTHVLSEERKQFQSQQESAKFDVNLQADLRAVLGNPSLLAEFKRIYPEKYHYLADNLRLPEQKQDAQQSVDPRIDQRLRQIEAQHYEQQQRYSQQQKEYQEAQVEAASATIDTIFGKMSQKYPLADEEVVIARAQALVDNGAKLIDEKGNPDDSMWDKIWKSVNDQSQKRYEGHYKKQVDQQKLASSKGKDMAAGGGIPDQAPKKIKFKDVADHAIAELTAQRQN